MQVTGVPGAAVAVARNGRVIIARGYGLLDKDDPHSAVNPSNIYRIASVSKPITAVAIIKLIQDGKLTMQTKVYNLLKSRYPLLPGKSLTAGIEKITVQHLLRHEGGWDRDSTGYDPMFDSVAIAAAAGVSPPAAAGDIIRHMWSQPLQFQPGTKSVYSNFGYCLLGRVIEKVTGRTYDDFVQNHVLSPMGITGLHLGRSRESGRYFGEATYEDGAVVTSSFPPHGQVPFAYGGFCIEAMDSHGGWVASPIGLVEFVSGLENNSLLSPATKALMTQKQSGDGNVYYGNGWMFRESGSDLNWWHNGSLPGTSAILVRTVRTDDSHLTWALLLNMRKGGDFDFDGLMWNAIGKLSAMPAPVFATPWKARHGLTGAQYQQHFGHLAALGYRLTTISGAQVGGQARYAGIWEQSAGPAWQARHGLTAAEYQAAFNDLGAQGYRIQRVSGYKVGARTLYAAIWEKRGGGALQARHRMSENEFRKTYNDLVWGQGYRMVDVSCYEVGGQPNYAAIFEKA